MSIDKTSHGVETFRMVPDRLWLDPRLQANDVRLWCALTFTARGRDRTGVSDQGLAKMMGWSPQTVRRSLLRLEECRFIERARQGEGRMITLRPGGDGRAIPEMEVAGDRLSRTREVGRAHSLESRIWTTPAHR